MKEFNEKIQAQMALMHKTGKLFRVALTGQQIWDMYLGSFENDPTFRDPESSVHNCNLCKNFLRRYGNIVAINENNEVMTLFDQAVHVKGEMAPVAMALSINIGLEPIVDVFFETLADLDKLPYEKATKANSVFQLGISKNVKRYTKEEAEKFGVVKPNEIMTFHHMHIFIGTEFVDKTGKTVEAITSKYRDAKTIFERGMETISLDTLVLVRDLINQGSLLDGQTHLYKVEQMILFKQEYDNLLPAMRNNWCWLKSYKFQLSKFRNELIGTLCVELSEGKELNAACQAWNKRVDPVNYMKTTAPITQKQIHMAKCFIEEKGYEESFNRRFANIDDIKVDEILHSNVGKQEIKKVSIFDDVKATSTRHKRSEFDGIEEITIDKFMKDVLPGCTLIEVFLRNAHAGHMASLTTANDPDSKRIFKWDNNYSWTFNGNLAGKSQIKEAVKEAGGNVDGVLNFRLAWNDAGKNDDSDLDAWAGQPNGVKIGYNTGYRKYNGNRRTTMSGQLDVDNTMPNGKLAVENITWTDKAKMSDGVYMLWVNQFNNRNSQGFKAEIEFDGETYSYEFNGPVRGNVPVANVTLKNGVFSIIHHLPESSGSREIYGLETNQFHKVNLVCLSPNHWGDNNVGNKHYFFMLDGCKSPVSIRSFHNENLIPELQEYRKVMEVLGATKMIDPSEKQLSGLGFNATVRDELIVRLSGSHKRTVKIKF